MNLDVWNAECALALVHLLAHHSQILSAFGHSATSTFRRAGNDKVDTHLFAALWLDSDLLLH